MTAPPGALSVRRARRGSARPDPVGLPPDAAVNIELPIPLIA